jgi:hypothetical protein
MTYYIYEIQPLVGNLKGKYYIGKHKTSNDPYNDDYAGSGIILKKYYQRYGKIEGVTYNKVILEFNDTEYNNCIREKDILSDC